MSTGTRTSGSREIDFSCQDIPAGWPRPYYLDNGQRKYAQWSSGRASSQIFECSTSRTYHAAVNHLCSSCGEQMEKGLIFDRDWVKKTAEVLEDPRIPMRGPRPGRGFGWDIDMRKMQEDDTHYGSPICFRCSVFALKHCPYFSAMAEKFGGDFTWIVTTSGQDYQELDETSALEVLDSNDLERITAREVQAEVQAGRLHLTGHPAEKFNPDQGRPRGSDGFDRTWVPASEGE